MATIGQMAVKLLLDAAQFTTEVEKHASAVEKVGQRIQEVGGKVTSAGKGLTAGVTLPLVGVGLAAVDAASDLDESINKVNVVFGEGGEAILAWSEDAAEGLGQSRQQALEAVGTYGNLLTALKLPTDQAADMSMGFVTLASDLASFNNASPEETLIALQSALTGEFEPMKRFGVAINQAALAQKALDAGLVETQVDMVKVRDAQLKLMEAQEKALEVEADKEASALDIKQANLDVVQAQEALDAALAGTVGEMDPAIKAQAAYLLVMEQTTNAQGDFQNTADGLANSTRIAQAQLKDQAAVLGTELLPIALEAVTIFRDLLARFQALSPEQKKQILIFAGIAAAVGPVLIVVGSLISGIGGIISVVGAALPVLGTIAAVLTGPVGLAIAAVAALVGLLWLAWENNFLNIQGFFEVWKTNMLGIFDAFKLLFQGDFEGFGEKLREIWDDTWERIKEIGTRAWEAIKDFFQNTNWGELGTSIMEKIATGITAGVQFIKDAAMAAVRAAIEAIAGFLGIDLDDLGLGNFGSTGSVTVGNVESQTFGGGGGFDFGGGAGAGAGLHLHLTTQEPVNIIDQFEVLKALASI